MTPQLHMWLHKSFQERTFPDLSSHLKETRSSNSPSAVDSTQKFPAQGLVLRLCKSGSAPTNSVHCPGGQVLSSAILHLLPGVTTPCSTMPLQNLLLFPAASEVAGGRVPGLEGLLFSSPENIFLVCQQWRISKGVPSTRPMSLSLTFFCNRRLYIMGQKAEAIVTNIQVHTKIFFMFYTWISIKGICSTENNINLK